MTKMAFTQIIVLLSVICASQVFATFSNGYRKELRMCEELLDKDACNGLEKTIKILKLKREDAKEFIDQATRKGLKSDRTLRRFVEKRIDTELKRKPCREILGKRRCQKISYYADKLGATAKKVRESIEEVISDGSWKTKQVYDRTLGKLRRLSRSSIAKKYFKY